MKGKMKKLVALALAAIMVLAMGITASAQEVKLSGGSASITIKNPRIGKDYTIYRVFNATETGEGENLKIAYTVVSDEAKAHVTDVPGFTVDANGNVTVSTEGNELSPQQIAKLKTYAETYGIAVDLNGEDEGVAINSNGTELVISGLPYGYYLVVSGAGSAVSIDSTQPEMVIYDKNPSEPAYPHKSVNDDKVTTGQKVEYQVWFATTNYQIVQQKDTEGNVTGFTQEKIYEYKIHDTLPEFLSDIQVKSIKVYENATISADGKTFTPSNNSADTKSLGLQQFANGYITVPWVEVATNHDRAHLYKDGAILEVVYEATVNDKVGYGVKNTNTVTITWNGKDTGITTTENIYSASIEIEKYAEGTGDAEGNNRTMLGGAEFIVLSKSVGKDGVIQEGTQYLVQTTTKNTKGEDITTLEWKSAFDATNNKVNLSGATTFTTDTNGKVTIKGLEPGQIYYLYETVAPNGYNRMVETVEVNVETIDDTTMEDTVIADKLQLTKPVSNAAGSLLPSTGGIGTTIFYVVGGLLVAGAGILLITKKRMRKEQ